MVVAAGTGHGQPHQPARDNVNPVVNDVVDIVAKAAADREKAHRGQVAPVGNVQQVGGQLLAEELVVRAIFVQGPDDVVAIGVGIRKTTVFGEDVPLGVGIAGHVQPVTPPALPVGGRG